MWAWVGHSHILLLFAYTHFMQTQRIYSIYICNITFELELLSKHSKIIFFFLVLLKNFKILPFLFPSFSDEPVPIGIPIAQNTDIIEYTNHVHTILILLLIILYRMCTIYSIHVFLLILHFNSSCSFLYRFLVDVQHLSVPVYHIIIYNIIHMNTSIYALSEALKHMKIYTNI